MVQKKFIKLGIIGVAVAALAIGLGVGLGTKKSNSAKQASAANSEEAADLMSGSYEDYANIDACIDPIAPIADASSSKGKGKGRRRRNLSFIPGDEDFVMIHGPGNRRKLRQEMMTRVLGKDTDMIGDDDYFSMSTTLAPQAAPATPSGSTGKGSSSKGSPTSNLGGSGGKGTNKSKGATTPIAPVGSGKGGESKGSDIAPIDSGKSGKGSKSKGSNIAPVGSAKVSLMNYHP